MTLPLVTVITPTKDRLPLLRQAIDSVQCQTFSAWEHLVIDDGSGDGTADEVAGRGRSDPRLRYISREGQAFGANVCRNLGIRNARGDLIVFLDSDDVLRSHCLEQRVDVMSANRNLDFAVWPAGVFMQSLGDLARLYHPQTPGDNLLRFLSLECPWEISGPVWRRTFLEKIGGFDEELLSMQDLELHVRALAARGRYIFLSDPDHDIRGQDDSRKTSVRHFKDPVFIRSAEAARGKLMNAVRKQGLLTWSRQRALVGLGFSTAESWLRAGRRQDAARAWAQTCREHGAPMTLRVAGLIMLAIACVSQADGDIPSRLVNKWKGRVRFRQEPSLMSSTNFVIQ